MTNLEKTLLTGALSMLMIVLTLLYVVYSSPQFHPQDIACEYPVDEITALNIRIAQLEGDAM